MKRGSRILLFLVVVIVILVAVAWLVFSRGGNPFAQTPTPTPPFVSVVMVAQPINMDDQIKPESLSTMQIPHVTDKMVTDPQTAVGKYANFPLAQGLPLTTDMFSDRPGTNLPGSAAAKIISPGLVAISIPITRGGAMVYGICKNDKVNVIVTTLFIDVDATFQSTLPNYTALVTGVGFIPDTLPTLSSGVVSGGEVSRQGRTELDPTLNQAFYIVPSEPQRPRLVSQMILQDVQVLHVGDFNSASQPNCRTEQENAAAAAAAQPGADGQPAPTAAPPPLPDSITLIVSPQDAVALTYFMQSRTVFTLTLRAPDDTTRVETEAATLQYLLSQYAIPVPAKLPYAMEGRLTMVPTPTPGP